MRHKRAKTYKKAIGIYQTAFGFRTPFQVLVSNDLLLILNRESDIVRQLQACCQGEVKPMITQCCMETLYHLGKEVQVITDIAKSFERRRCNHRTAIPPDECLKDVIGGTNKHRYVLAAQSKTLRLELSAIPGLPIIHFNPRGVLVLSPPSHATLKTKDAQEESRRLEGADMLDGLEEGENVVGASSKSVSKRNRPKGPNPLSVKKKKTASSSGEKGKKAEGEVQTAAEVAVKKSRRKRGKGLVKQVKEEMAKEEVEAEAREAGQEADGGETD